MPNPVEIMKLQSDNGLKTKDEVILYSKVFYLYDFFSGTYFYLYKVQYSGYIIVLYGPYEEA